MSAQENKNHILIIGAGIIGLQCALTILEEGNDEYAISIVAEHIPGDDAGVYASAWAGAQWRSHEDSFTEAAEWDVQTYRYWKGLLDGGERGCGIAVVKGRNYWADLKDSNVAGTVNEGQTKDKPDPWWSEYVESYRVIDQSDLPPNTIFGISFDTFTIEVQRYLGYLQSKIQALGGIIVRARLSSDEGFKDTVAAAKYALGLASLYCFSAIVNASGIGARELVSDKTLYPIRGQTVRVQGVAKYCTTRLGNGKNDRTAIIPRPGENITIIGVTVEPDIENTKADLDVVPELLQAAKPYSPELLNEQGEFTMIGTGVGLRPGRKGGARVELERMDDLIVVHAYGVAGAGYQNSIGLARKVLRLLQNHPP